MFKEFLWEPEAFAPLPLLRGLRGLGDQEGLGFPKRGSQGSAAAAHRASSSASPRPYPYRDVQIPRGTLRFVSDAVAAGEGALGLRRAGVPRTSPPVPERRVGRVRRAASPTLQPPPRLAGPTGGPRRSARGEREGGRVARGVGASSAFGARSLAPGRP